MAKIVSKDRRKEIQEAIKSFPTGPGLYFMKDAEDKVLYIGKAKNLRSRAGSYFQPGANLEESRGPWIVEMVGEGRGGGLFADRKRGGCDPAGGAAD